MRHSSEAFHDSDIVDRSPCHPETRKDILSEIETWAMDASSEPGYWMFGLAGTGKSTIAFSVCEILKGRKVLAATFFCSRQIPKCNNYRLIIPTLSYQLARFSRTFAMSVKEILAQDSNIVTKRPEVQMEKLLIEPWKAVMKAAQMRSFHPVLVLDALDECQDFGKVLQPLVSAISKKELQGLKFFITSRPEPKIQAELKAYSASGMKEFILHNVEEDIVQHDISVYFQKEFQEISLEEGQLNMLTNLSQQLFIYAATVVRFVKEADGIVRRKKRLHDCIENAANLKDLNALYVEILDKATEKLQDEEMQDDLNIIHTIVSVGKPLTCQTIAELLHAEVESVSNLIHRLYAVFYMRETDGLIIIFHKSFYDFFFSFKDSKYKYNAGTQHESLTFSCFQIMEKLCFNICDLPSSFIKDDDVPGFKNKVSKKIPETLNYCCQFWTDHFEIGQTDQLFQKVQEVLIEKGIYWLEAMSLLKSLPRCSKMLDAILKTSSNKADHSSIERIVNYLQNLIRQFINGDVFGMTPHLYLSIMPFWENDVGCKPQLQRGIKLMNRVIDWLPENTVTVNVSTCINSVQYSPIGDKIGAGCDDNTVRIWDARTGIQIGEPLQGHDDLVSSVAFSPDGTRIVIVSGSHDRTLRIWDARTGTQIGVPLLGHNSWVNSVAFSPDGTRIVSGSHDDTLRIWDARTGAQIGVPLLGHHNGVSSVAFSPDGTRIVSGGDSRTLRIWDARTGTQIGVPLWGHNNWVSSVAFSPDGTRIVSGSHDRTLRIWDARTGTQIGVPLQGHDDLVSSVAFSPDGTRIVSGSHDTTLRIWDARTGTQIGVPLQGHVGSVWSVAFSPDGTRIVSGSNDTTLRIWDARTGTQIGMPLQGQSSVKSVAFSPDGTTIVSGSYDETLKFWDARTGTQIGMPLLGHHNWVSSVAFSPDGTRIVSGSYDKTLRFWDARTGTQSSEPLQGHGCNVTSDAESLPDSVHRYQSIVPHNGKLFLVMLCLLTDLLLQICIGLYLSMVGSSFHLSFNLLFGFQFPFVKFYGLLKHRASFQVGDSANSY
ncbi:quinon protein alcohol dehydrogenase-like superfamily [Lentinula edodes]|nr:quinon protein alcohol dehydrogenase-like superfamily [Lentinula edodes]